MNFRPFQAPTGRTGRFSLNMSLASLAPAARTGQGFDNMLSKYTHSNNLRKKTSRGKKKLDRNQKQPYSNGVMIANHKTNPYWLAVVFPVFHSLSSILASQGGFR